MCKQLSRLAIICLLVAMVSCSRKPEPDSIDPVGLLGLSEEQIFKKLGKPDINDSRTAGHTEFLYKNIRLRVFLEDGITTACYIGDASPISLNDRIRCGIPITDVIKMYGAYTSEEEVTNSMTSDQYLQGVLYHRWLSPDTERYSLRYPDKQLLFTFYPDKTLHSVWLGKIY